MSDLTFALINGILIGLIYALIGSGLNIIFGVLRVVNFAHGGILILSSYVSWVLYTTLSLNPLISVVIVPPIFFLIGLCIYYLFVPRLLNSNDTEMASFILFFGLYIVIETTMRFIWGPHVRAIQYPYGGVIKVSVSILNYNISSLKLISGSISLVVLLCVAYFLFYTYTGKAMRAIIQNRDAVKFLGIRVSRISALAFGIGLYLSSIAGVLITLVFPSFSPTMGQFYTLLAFAIIVLGGLGDPIGAMIAGIVFSLIEQIVILFLPQTASPAVAFILLIILILYIPDGLFRVKYIRDIWWHRDK